MSNPEEHKTVQARILAYAQEIGSSFISREVAEQRRASSPEGYAGTSGHSASTEQIRSLSLFFDAKVWEFNPRYAEAEGALLRQFRLLQAVLKEAFAPAS